MAVGTVSGVDPQDNWQLISSSTPSGTSVTFSSLSGYKHLWVVGKGITKSAADYVGMRPNNDTTAGNYATITVSSGVGNKFLISGYTGEAQAFSAKIYDIDKTIPHLVEWGYSDVSYGLPSDAYVNPVAITSLVIFNQGGSATFSGGTLYLYGIPA